MDANKKRIGFILVFGASSIAILFAIVQIISGFKTLALYNLIRALIFAGACIYLYRNPAKVNFIGPLKFGDGGNTMPLNMKISYFLSYVFSVVNLAISLALYFDP